MPNEENKKRESQNDSKVIKEDISSQMRSSYLDYAMSVITGRALPDVRDGLKPVHRRILFAMNGMGLNSTAKTRKSAAITGEVLGKYHPHGNQAVYDSMVKMAQEFVTRYPLVIGQGNFGSIDGDPPAAERYTEAKLSKISETILNDLEKNTVQWQPNYENTRKEPSVLPSMAPNLLINGTFGIAVGMATMIPPHNLKEVCEAAKCLLENKEADFKDLLNLVKGPDFPTGAIAYDKTAIANAYETGKGSVVVRGEVEIVENGKQTSILITSIPYRVNKSELMSKIGTLVREKKIEGIKDLRDESTEDTRIVIDLKSSAQPNLILNRLYKHTQLEDTFHYNMVALVDGVPKTLSLVEILEEYLSHRRIIIRKRTEFDLNKAKEKEHILEGLSKAIDNIDKIVAFIKKSKDVVSAHSGLVKEFKFSSVQATAILEMKLQKLASLERKKIEDQLKEIKALIKKLEIILSSEKNIDGEISKEIDLLIEKYGDKRRTKIKPGQVGSINEEDLVAEEDSVLVLTYGGYVKRTNPKEYRQQKRGGVGSSSFETKEEDSVKLSLKASTRDTILFFTNKGKVYKKKMYELPEGKKTNKGKAIINFIPISQDEQVTSILSITENNSKDSVVLCTEKGTIKRLGIDAFANIRKSGIIALKLSKNDNLKSSFMVSEDETMMISTKCGKSIRMKVSDVRKTGRTSQGVKGIELQSGDSVIAAFCIPKEASGTSILTISSKGYGKLTDTKEYKVQKRGGSGVKIMEINKTTGKLASADLVVDTEKVIITMSKKGIAIKIPINSISLQGRSTQGVKIMKPKAGDEVASSTQI